MGANTREVDRLRLNAFDFAAQLEDALTVGTGETSRVWSGKCWGAVERKELHRRLDEAIARHNSWIAQATERGG